MSYIKYCFLGLMCFTLLISCGEDDEQTCTTCTSEFTQAFELCRSANGNALVDGENTQTDYDIYLQGLQETGVLCGQ